jgi:hypothetical protein
MAGAGLVTHHCHEQRLARPAGLDQKLLLEQGIVLAVTVTVSRKGPFLDHAEVLDVGHRHDAVVDPFVDAHELAPGIRGESHIARRGRLDGAVLRILTTKPDPAAGGAHHIAGHCEQIAVAAGLGVRRQRDEHRRERTHRKHLLQSELHRDPARVVDAEMTWKNFRGG